MPTTTPRVDLETAKRLLGWVNDHGKADGRGGVRWPLAVNDAAASSGFELGAAGIAWVNLRAAQATGDRSYRDVARRAGVWLRRVATAGSTWNELPGDLGTPVHVGLDSGAAGIGWVLADLADAGIDLPRIGQRRGPLSPRSTPAPCTIAPARCGTRTVTGGKPALPAEPSWHWGSAGIAAFAARLAGWSGRSPGGQRTR